MDGISDLYGVLKGKVVRYDEADARTDRHSPHVYIYVECNKQIYKTVVNIKSAPKKPIIIDGKKVPNELLYIADSSFDADQITHLQELDEGFYPIRNHNKFVYKKTDYSPTIPVEFPKSKYDPKDIAVDFVRNKLFDPCEMKIMPADKSGKDNDLADFFKTFIEGNAIKNKATIYVYGGHFDDGKGIHEIHMNQGSKGQFEPSNGVYQDGCILLEYPDNHWEAVFLAFQSQSWCTNDDNGDSTKSCFIYDHKTGQKICNMT